LAVRRVLSGPGVGGSGCVLREPSGPAVAPLLRPLCIVRAYQIKRLCVSSVELGTQLSCCA
jgi:hypothetical protein